MVSQRDIRSLNFAHGVPRFLVGHFTRRNMPRRRAESAWIDRTYLALLRKPKRASHRFLI